MKLLRLRKPSPATVIACIALFVALGGTSVAAVTLAKNSVLSKHIKNGQVKTADLGASAVNSSKVGDGSLLAQDFAAGQLPSGAQGAQGPKGDTGTVDTSNFYTKSDSDSRFLGTNGKAADSELLDGLDSTAFLGNQVGNLGLGQGISAFTFLTIPGHGELQGACGNPAQPTVSWKNTSGGEQRLFVDDGVANATHIHPLANDASGGAVTGSQSLGVADHVTYLVREPGHVWIDVFDTVPSSGICFFYARAYGS